MASSMEGTRPAVNSHPGVSQQGQRAGHTLELDALVIGGGFGGVYLLKRLRDEGRSVKLVEAGSDYGGVWYWARYPGARVDVATPQYEFSDPALWAGWKWKQRFPGGAELRAYFSYVAQKWDLRRDTVFDHFVTSAAWDAAEQRWLINTDKGMTFKAKFFLPSVGFAAKRHIPDWKGVNSFKGALVHSSHWPEEEPNLEGKRVAIIGTGATGVQLAQEISQVAKELVIFQRTPNLALPMGQIDYQGTEQSIPQDEYAELFAARDTSWGGIPTLAFLPTATFDHTPEQRKETYEQLWKEGDFSFWLGTYYDMLFSPNANTEAYNFWRDKTRARIEDSRMKDRLAPMVKPHNFGCKRIALERGYFEIFNRPNVQLVDVNETPVTEVTESGIKTTERDWDLDYVVCATGYDALTGGLLQMGIRGKEGQTLKQKWECGVRTYLGMATVGFPNCFFTYGPQAPTSFCNGPTCAELQGDWIVGVMNYMRANRLVTVEASEESGEQWAAEVLKLANASLLPTAKSWYMGDNIPGKRREPLIYLGGVPAYYKTLHACAEKGYEGFHLA